MRPVNEIIWHCTATPEGRDHTVADIDHWHKQRGWRGIGYHYVVYRDGSVHKGRPITEIGAHVGGKNTGTIGCVYVGGMTKDMKAPKDTRTAAQKTAMLKLTRDLANKYPTIKKVSGHNEYAAKACPSFNVQKDELGRALEAPAPKPSPAPKPKPRPAPKPERATFFGWLRRLFRRTS